MEETSYNTLIGFTKGKIIKVNPELDWVVDNYDDGAEEKDYFFEKKNGNKVAILDFYIEDPKGNIYLNSIELENEQIQYKTGTVHFLNQSGAYQICQNEEQLFNNFTNFVSQKWSNGKLEKEELLGKREYRKAVKGEDHLVNLLKHFINPKNENESVLLDLDKIFAGDISEIEELVLNDADFHFVTLLYSSPELQQKVWNEFLHLKILPEINNNSISKYNKTTFDKYLKNLEYLKGYYTLERARPLRNSDIPEVKEINETDDNY